MTKRVPVTAAPGPLEQYAAAFDSLFGQRNQRQAFRRYLEGLLLPAEHNKTLTMLANIEPVVGAQEPRAQGLQWFLSESMWDPCAANARRLELLRADVATEPTGEAVLAIDELGDRKWGNKTAHVGKQYLTNLGKIDNGVHHYRRLSPRRDCHHGSPRETTSHTASTMSAPISHERQNGTPSACAISDVMSANRTMSSNHMSCTFRRTHSVVARRNDAATIAARMSAKAITPHRSTASGASMRRPPMAKAMASNSAQLSICIYVRSPI